MKTTQRHEHRILEATPPPTPVSDNPNPPLPRVGNSTTAYFMYLREIGQIQLLTPEEEAALAKRIRAGDESARQHMIKANLRLVVKIARDYEGCGVPLLDLISEGNIGLMKAVQRFNPDLGAKLSTYAAWWIKQAIRRALSNQSKTIRLPVHVGDKLFRLQRLSVRLEETLGREPTDEELAAELEMRTSRVAALRRAALTPSSLDAPVGPEDGKRFEEIIADEKGKSPDVLLEEKNSIGQLSQILGTLSPRERTILAHRFGLDGRTELTLEEIGAELGVTRERIRQIQNLALAKLRKLMDQQSTLELAA